MPTIAEQLAAFGQDITYDALPPDVIQKAKATILDTIGCAFGGLHSDPHRIVQAVVKRLGGAPDATVIGSADKNLHAVGDLDRTARRSATSTTTTR